MWPAFGQAISYLSADLGGVLRRHMWSQGRAWVRGTEGHDRLEFQLVPFAASSRRIISCCGGTLPTAIVSSTVFTPGRTAYTSMRVAPSAVRGSDDGFSSIVGAL